MYLWWLQKTFGKLVFVSDTNMCGNRHKYNGKFYQTQFVLGTKQFGKKNTNKVGNYYQPSW